MDQALGMQMRKRFAQREANLQDLRSRQSSFFQIGAQRPGLVGRAVPSPPRRDRDAPYLIGSWLRGVRQLHHVVEIALDLIAPDVEERELAGMFAGDSLKMLNAGELALDGRSFSNVCRQTIFAARSAPVALLGPAIRLQKHRGRCAEATRNPARSAWRLTQTRRGKAVPMIRLLKGNP
jgi:hypothetical protein